MNEDKDVYNPTDPYLRFNGPAYDSTPRELIPFIDTIRKECEWENVGFEIKKDKYGNCKPFVKKGLWFRLTALVFADHIKLKAIETGKKCTTDPTGVMLLIKQGCAYDDFVYVSEDVKAYCEACKWYDQKQYEKALQQIKRAFELKPDETLYANLLFEIRLILGDKSTIDDEIKYYANDMDSMVHTGRAYKWVKFLVVQRDFNKASGVINTVISALDDLAVGRRENRRYGGKQNSNWYRYKKDQFNKKIASLQKRIEKSQNTSATMQINL